MLAAKIETDPNKIADEFNNYFINISKHIKEKIPPTRKHFSEYLKRSSINSFFFQFIETEEISKIITKMHPKKVSGPFSKPNKILVLTVSQRFLLKYLIIHLHQPNS